MSETKKRKQILFGAQKRLVDKPLWCFKQSYLLSWKCWFDHTTKFLNCWCRKLAQQLHHGQTVVLGRWPKQAWRTCRAWRVCKPQEFIKDSRWLHYEEVYTNPTSKHTNTHTHTHTQHHTHMRPSGGVLLCLVCCHVPCGKENGDQN